MLGEAHDGVQGAGCSSGEMLGGSAGRDVEWSARRDVERRAGWEAEWKTMRCGVRWGGMGRGKNGVRNHFGRHFTNIVYIIKKMF